MIAGVSGVLAEREGESVVIQTDGGVAYAVSVRVVARSSSSELLERLRDALDFRREPTRVARD